MRRAAAGLILFCVTADTVRAIGGDGVTEATGHPEAVLISATDPATGRHARASGVLVAPRVVLTAAHAVEGFARVTVDAPYAADRPRSSAVESVRIFPGYSAEKPGRDLAVLILTDRLAEARELPGIYGGDLLPLDTELTIVGRVEGGKVSDDKLFAAPVTLAGFPDSFDLYGGFPRRAQPGDSGGPVYVRGRQNRLVGVVSRYSVPNRRHVSTDGYVPLGAHNRAWILAQYPR